MSEQSDDKRKWNSRYVSTIDISPPAQVLTENFHLLPAQGIALDLACGLGANAMFLAEHGLETSAWDISDVAISLLQERVIASGLYIQTEVRDVVQKPPAKHSFDVIVVSRFLDRTITGSLIDALNPGGFLYYQTFVVDKQVGIGPSNLDYLLQANELLSLFQSLTVRVYREEGLAGDLKKGFRNEAMLVAQKLST